MGIKSTEWHWFQAWGSATHTIDVNIVPDNIGAEVSLWAVALAFVFSAVVGVYSRPVSASTAITLLGGSVKYITPSTTKGVVSTTWAVRIW